MTVSVTSGYSGPYLPDGLTTAFPFTFNTGSADEVQVLIDDALVSSGFTITINADQSANPGGTVTFSVAPTGASLVIASDPDFTQEIAFTDSGPFLATSHDEVADQAARKDIALLRETARAFKVPLGSVAPSFADMAASFRGDPGGDGSLVGLFTTIATQVGGTGVTIPADIDLIQTTGYSTADVGSAVYAYDAAVDAAYVTAHPRTSFIETGGRGFRISPEQDFTPEMFGALADGTTDDSAAFQAAIDNLPATGGTIFTPASAYALGTQPSVGAKSIHWQFGSNTVFSGAGSGEGKFPYANTNVASLPVGPYILSQSSQHSTNSNGAVNALTVEMLQPSSYGAGGSVGIYAAAKTAVANAGAFVWAMNPLVRMEAGSLGGGYGIEVDVDNYSASASAVGVLVSGTGDHNPLAAVITDRLAGKWQTGINVRAALDGVVVFGETGGRGVVVDAPASTLVSPYNATFSGRQFANNLDTLFLQRFTDTTPTGYFMRFRNAADSADLFSIDVAGKTLGSTLTLVAATPVVSSGQLGIGTTTATSATAGTNGAVPAQVLGYLVMSLGGTSIKVPYYAA